MDVIDSRQAEDVLPIECPMVRCRMALLADGRARAQALVGLGSMPPFSYP